MFEEIEQILGAGGSQAKMGIGQKQGFYISVTPSEFSHRFFEHQFVHQFMAMPGKA